MKEISDKEAGGTIPGPGNYQADEFNEGIKRDLLSPVKLSGQTPDQNNFLQLCDAIARMGITANYYIQIAFSANEYTLESAGYTGSVDPGATLSSPQQFDGPTNSLSAGGDLIIFQPLNSSTSGTDIEVSIPLLNLNNIPVFISNHVDNFRSANISNDFTKNEYVILQWDGSNFIRININVNDINSISLTGYEVTGFNQATNFIDVQSVSGIQPQLLYDGMEVRFAPNFNIENTEDGGGGPVTLRINPNLPSYELLIRAGVRLQPNDISVSDYCVAIFDSSLSLWILQSKPASRIKYDYDQSSYWASTAVNDVIGTASSTLYILTPSSNALGANQVTTSDQTSRHIRIGTRITFKPFISNDAGPVILRFAYNITLAVGVYPNIIPDAQIRTTQFTQLSRQDMQGGTVVTVIYDGSNWILENNSPSVNKIFSTINDALWDDTSGTVGQIYNVFSPSNTTPFSSYNDGMTINVRLESINTTQTPEINVDGLGNVLIVTTFETGLPLGSITAGDHLVLQYRASTGHFRLIQGIIATNDQFNGGLGDLYGVGIPADHISVAAQTSETDWLTPSILSSIEFLNIVWPIGSVWQAATDGATPPGTGTGGVSWQELVTQGSVLMSVTSGSGQQFGSESIGIANVGTTALTTAQMPAHSHTTLTAPEYSNSPNSTGPWKDSTDTHVLFDAGGFNSWKQDGTTTVGSGSGHTHSVNFLRHTVRTYIRVT